MRWRRSRPRPEQAEVQALAERRAQELLNRHRPATKSELDLRGWEWRYLWHICQGDDLFTLCRRTNTIWSLAPSADGRALAVGEYFPGGLSIWDVRTRQEISNVPAAGWSVMVAFSPRGSLLAYSTRLPRTNSAEGQYEVHVIDLATRQPVATLPNLEECHALTFSEDGSTLATITDGTPGAVTLWQLPHGRKLASVAAEELGENFGACLTRDLRLAAYAMRGGRLRLMDLMTGRARWTAKAADDLVLGLAFSPNGALLASTAGYVLRCIQMVSIRESTNPDHGAPAVGMAERQFGTARQEWESEIDWSPLGPSQG